MDALPDSGARPLAPGVVVHPDGWWDCGAGHVHGPELDPADGCPEPLPDWSQPEPPYNRVVRTAAAGPAYSNDEIEKLLFAAEMEDIFENVLHEYVEQRFPTDQAAADFMAEKAAQKRLSSDDTWG